MSDAPRSIVSVPRTHHQHVLTRFASALRRCVYDKQVEHTRTVQYFFDADIVYPAVGGALVPRESLMLGEIPQATSTNLVQALLSVGLFSPVRILLPHATELVNGIERLKAGTGMVAPDEQLLTRALGLEDTLRAIEDLAEKGAPASAVVALLSEVGPQAFVALCLTADNWRARLKLIQPVLEEPPVTLQEIVNSTVTTRILQDLSRIRDAEGLDAANYTDALALTSLHYYIKHAEKNHDAPCVRFYTETPAILRTWRASSSPSVIRSLLTEAPVGQLRDKRSAFIYRDADYFLLRACVPALCFPRNEPQTTTSPSDDSPPLQDLVAAAEDLTQVIEVDAIAQIVARRGLDAAVTDFAQAAFLKHVWSNTDLYRAPDPSKGSTWSRFWALRSSATIAGDITIVTSDATESLFAKTAQYKVLALTARKLLRAVERKLESMPRPIDDTLPDPFVELGASRWGVNDPVSGDRIQQFIEDLFFSGRATRLSSCGQIAAAIMEPERVPKEVGALAVILWHLEAYDPLCRMLERFQTRSTEMPIGLRAMAIVAPMRLHRTAPINSVEDAYESLARELAENKGPVEPSAHLSLAYVCYYAWYRDTGGDIWVCRQPEACSDSATVWAERSIWHAQKTTEGTPDRSPEWAFGHNLVAYIGAIMKLHPIFVRKSNRILQTLQGHPGLWHYRFADTIAVVYMTDAIDMSRKEGGSSNSAQAEACLALRNAYEYLGPGMVAFGDPDIPAHRTVLSDLVIELGCSRLAETMASLPSSQ